MTDTQKQILMRFVLPVASAIVVGIGSAAVSTWGVVSGMDSRVATLEQKAESQQGLPGRIDKLETTIDRHEKALDRDFMRHEQVVAVLSNKTDDQERRLTRLEALVGETQALLAEIRMDIKTLLSGRAKH